MSKHRQEQEDPLKALEATKDSQVLKASMINSEEQKVRDRDRGKDKDKGRGLETYLRSLRRSLEEKVVREEVGLSKHNRQKGETLW